jgi:hypothetical protein
MPWKQNVSVNQSGPALRIEVIKPLVDDLRFIVSRMKTSGARSQRLADEALDTVCIAQPFGLNVVFDSHNDPSIEMSSIVDHA